MRKGIYLAHFPRKEPEDTPASVVLCKRKDFLAVKGRYMNVISAGFRTAAYRDIAAGHAGGRPFHGQPPALLPVCSQPIRSIETSWR
jgi:hypothetical protein